MKNAALFLLSLLLSVGSALAVGELTFSIFWLLVALAYMPGAINDTWNLYIQIRREL